MPKSRRFFSAQNRRELLLPALFIAPALAVLLSLSIYPLIYSVTISLQQETAGRMVWSLGNFARLVSDNFFLNGDGPHVCLHRRRTGLRIPARVSVSRFCSMHKFADVEFFARACWCR